MEFPKKSMEKAWRFLKLINLSKEIRKPRPVAGFFVYRHLGLAHTLLCYFLVYILAQGTVILLEDAV